MKGFLLLFFVFILQSASAQVAATATASVTIVNPVGTQAVNNNDLSFVTSAIQEENSIAAFLPNKHTKQIDLAKFSIVNSTSLYTLTVQSNEPHRSNNYVYASSQQYALTIKPLQAAKAESFVLGVNVDAANWQTNKEANATLDVIIHFN